MTIGSEKMLVRALHLHEVEQAVLLIQEVFLETEARDLAKYAVDSFLQMQTKEGFLRQLQKSEAVFLGAFSDRSELLGVLFAEGSYLSHLYVRRRGEGIGKVLLLSYEEILRNRMESEVITLNATRSAVPFYELLGFVVKDNTQEICGISFVPMEKKQKDEGY